MAGAPIDFPSSWTGENFVPPTPLDITTIERAIVNQLRSAIGDQVEVGHFPDRPEAYRLTHRVGAAQVIFQGADYGELLDANYVVQERTLHFGVRVMTRDLGWAYGGQPSGLSPGGYGLLEAIRAALAGFIVPGCTKMVPERERFLDHDEQGAVWFYSIEFALRTMAIEVEPNRNDPLLMKGQAFEQGGDTRRTVPAANYTFDSSDQIALPYQNLSGVVVKNTAGTVIYAAGADYSVDDVNGIITRLATGSIPSLGTVSVAYNYAEVVTAIAGGGNAPTSPTN